jgi:cytochrome c5
VSREQDRIFIRNFVGVIALLIGVTIALITIANSLFHGNEQAVQELAKERAEKNLEPVGKVRLTGEPMPEVATASSGGGAEASSGPRSGEQVVQAVCAACHEGNFMNAPQVGDKAQWQKHVGKGMDTLVNHVKNGFGNMPPQGGQVSDEEIQNAIKYMVEDKTGLSLK